jgi:hypothetical protein
MRCGQGACLWGEGSCPVACWCSVCQVGRVTHDVIGQGCPSHLRLLLKHHSRTITEQHEPHCWHGILLMSVNLETSRTSSQANTVTHTFKCVPCCAGRDPTVLNTLAPYLLQAASLPAMPSPRITNKRPATRFGARLQPPRNVMMRSKHAIWQGTLRFGVSPRAHQCFGYAEACGTRCLALGRRS